MKNPLAGKARMITVGKQIAVQLVHSWDELRLLTCTVLVGGGRRSMMKEIFAI